VNADADAKAAMDQLAAGAQVRDLAAEANLGGRQHGVRRGVDAPRLSFPADGERQRRAGQVGVVE